MSWLYSPRKMVEVVEEHQLEVLHVHYAIPHAYAAYMAKANAEEKRVFQYKGGHYSAWYGYYLGR